MRKTGYHTILLTGLAFLLSCCVQPTDNSYNKNVSAMNALLNENIWGRRFEKVPIGEYQK